MAFTGPELVAALTVVAVVGLAAVVALVVVLLRGRHAGMRADQQRAQVRAMTSRLSGLAELTGTGLLVQSSDGRLLDLDDRAARALGVDPVAAVGRPVGELPVVFVDDAGRRLLPDAVLAPPPPHAGPVGRETVVVGVVDGGPADEEADGDVPVAAVTRRVRLGSCPLPPTPGVLGAVLTAVAEVGGGADRSEVDLHAAAQAAPVALALAEAGGRVLEANRAFADLVGGPDAVPEVDLGGGADAAWHQAVADLVSGDRRRTEVVQRWSRPDGSTVRVALDLALAPGVGPDGARSVAVVARDVTAERERADRLTHRALHDPLTGLANRAHLLDTLRDALEQPDAGDRVAVLACDLDGFRAVNDRYGHAAGDEALVQMAAALRAATGSRGTVARLSGDSFVVVVDDADGARAAREVAARIHAGLREPMRIQGHAVPVAASVAIAPASSSPAGEGPAGVLAAAHAALRRAKAGGRSRTELYDPAVDDDRAASDLAAALPGALERGEVVVHLQPVVDLADGRVVGEEAQVRVQHPQRGLLPADVVDDAVREAGLAADLARHVLERAVDHLARTSAAGRWVAVGVDTELLGDGELVRGLLDDLRARELSPARVVVQLAGGVPVDAAHRLRRDLATLRAAGVRVLLDRFGAGASTVSSLRELAVDGIRLDPSFAAGVVDDPAARRVVQALGAMARELELLTVADGVDSADHAEVLRDAGWQLGQGWAFGGPQPLQL